VKKFLVLLAVALLAVPVFAGRLQTTTTIDHGTACVFEAYPGDSNNTDLSFGGTPAEVISAVPGVLKIVPGTDWKNFVSAGDRCYGLKGVVLHKCHPDFIQCPIYNDLADVWQRSSGDIRLWWPLMYEAPGTTWTLEVTWAYCGDITTRYVDVWGWKVCAGKYGTSDTIFASVKNVIKLLHELPYGICEVPLISDEDLYPKLLSKLADIESAWPSNPELARDELLAFEDLVSDNCIYECPPSPMATDPQGRLGITNTKENPACCKLLADAEFIGFDTGIFQQSK